MKVMIHFHFRSFSLSPTTTKWLTCFHFCFWSFCVVQEIATFILLPRRRRRSQKLFELLFPRIIIQSETETFSLADLLNPSLWFCLLSYFLVLYYIIKMTTTLTNFEKAILFFMMTNCCTPLQLSFSLKRTTKKRPRKKLCFYTKTWCARINYDFFIFPLLFFWLRKMVKKRKKGGQQKNVHDNWRCNFDTIPAPLHYREFSNERTRVERRETFRKLRMKENFSKAFEGYFQWIIRAGENRNKATIIAFWQYYSSVIVLLLFIFRYHILLRNFTIDYLLYIKIHVNVLHKITDTLLLLTIHPCSTLF